MTVSYLIIALGLLQVFNGLGIRPSLLTAGVGHVVINLPLCFAILYAAMGDQQKAAERAARDLGAASCRSSPSSPPPCWPRACRGLLPLRHLQLGRIHHRLPPHPLRRHPAGRDLVDAEIRPLARDQCRGLPRLPRLGGGCPSGRNPDLPEARMTASVEIRSVSRTYGTQKVLDRVSLSIAPGEFVVLLGPRAAARPRCSTSSAASPNRQRGRSSSAGATWPGSARRTGPPPPSSRTMRCSRT